jgi:3-methyladenine DNA glycosylase AlkD
MDAVLANSKLFPQSEEVRKIEADNPYALLSGSMRLNLRRISGSLVELRRASRSGSHRQSLSAQGFLLALNQQGALVARKMDKTDRKPDRSTGRQIEEPGRAGVTVLAEEIEERLSGIPNPTTPQVREVRREFTHRLKDAAPHVVIELGGLLIDLQRIDCRSIAYELIYHHPAALSHLNAWQLEQLGRGIASWSAVDCFAVYLAGPVWRGRRVPNSLIHGWARSADRWWRRAALVSTVPLNSKTQGGAGDTYRTLQVCRLLERDRDPMVVKALSWALRELAKRDPRAVREYLGARKDALPAVVVREVTNKLRTGVKNPKSKSAAAK